MWYVYASATPLRAAQTLRAEGLECIVHMTHTWKRAHRTAKKRKPARVPTPAYGVYFFVRVPNAAAWTALRLSRAKARPISVDGGEPRPLRDASMILTPPHGIFHDTEVSRYVAPAEQPKFSTGDKVMFSWSGLDGLRSEVLDVSADKVRVALKILGAEFVDVPAEAVVRAA